MTDAKLLEAWLRLSADAVRGAEQAREAMRMLGQQAPDPDTLTEWMTKWFPSPVPSSASGRQGGRDATKVPGAEELLSLAEDWWRGLGVVPRYQYVEALKRCEDLTRRLEEAEATIARLRELAEADRDAERGEAVKETLDTWEELTRRALEAQAEWARSWGAGFAKKPGERG